MKNPFSFIKKKFSAMGHYDTHGYKNKRKLVLAFSSLIVLVVMGAAFFAGGMLKSRSLTGLVIQQEQELEGLKTNLSEIENNFEIASQELILAREELSTKQEELAQKEQEASDLAGKLSGKEAELESYKEESSQLETELNDIKEENDELKEENEKFTEAIGSSAWDICCNANDVKNGNQKNWEINDGAIECSGQYTVNCDTRETNFNNE